MDQYKSSLAPAIGKFLEQKEALGFKYTENRRYLHKFDTMCSERFPYETTVTKDMALAWAVATETESRAGLSRRLSPVRELARFLQRSGREAFVIPDEYGRAPYRTYIPFIFSSRELQALFHAADALAENDKFPLSAAQPAVYLRLLYACGLRPYEGRMILRKNIDLENGTIFIPESKRLKDRVVVMDASMLEQCRQYEKILCAAEPDSDYFFPVQSSVSNKRHCFHDSHWAARMLGRCLINAGITDFGSRRPRPYDLRHTFATHTLYRWLKEGRNLDSCIPYLSAYMGHAKYQHTAYYIHLVPDFFPQIGTGIEKKFSQLLPEADL